MLPVLRDNYFMLLTYPCWNIPEQCRSTQSKHLTCRWEESCCRGGQWWGSPTMCWPASVSSKPFYHLVHSSETYARNTKDKTLERYRAKLFQLFYRLIFILEMNTFLMKMFTIFWMPLSSHFAIFRMPLSSYLAIFWMPLSSHFASFEKWVQKKCQYLWYLESWDFRWENIRRFPVQFL